MGDKILLSLLNPLFKFIPSRWKSAVGLTCLLVILCLHTLGKISNDEYATYGGFAEALFGIGIYMKVANAEKPAVTDTRKEPGV